MEVSSSSTLRKHSQATQDGRQALKAGRTSTGGTEGRRATRTSRTTTATAKPAGALILNTTLLSIVRSRSNAGILSAVDANRDPREDTVRDVVTEQNVLHKGVDGLSFLGQDAVFGVGGQILRVGGVGRCLLHLGDQVLVEEELADVRG